MAQYTKQFTKPYPDGYIDKPVMTTPVTADILNMYERVLAALEDFLASDDVGFKKGLTVGIRQGGNIGNGSLVVGYGIASGDQSLAVGVGSATGKGAFSCGNYTTASGENSVATGAGSRATGNNSHAEGLYTEASELGAHSEGASTKATAANSHSEGGNTKASGTCSHVEGSGTIAAGELQHVQGRYNVEDAEGVYAHIVGGGTYNERRNIHTLDWEGNAVFAGNVTDGNGDSIAGLKGEIPKEEAVDIDFSNYFL